MSYKMATLMVTHEDTQCWSHEQHPQLRWPLLFLMWWSPVLVEDTRRPLQVGTGGSWKQASLPRNDEIKMSEGVVEEGW